MRKIDGLEIFLMSSSNNMIIKNNVREYRLYNSLTQSQLAKKLCVSKNCISSIERGEYYPSLELAFKLVNFFDCRFEELFVYVPLD